MIKNFDCWEVYEGFSAGSGASEKIWLINSVTGKIGLFKYPKTDVTTEHVSEKLASSLGEILNIPCAVVDVGTYNGRLGSMSYLINYEGQWIIEGVHLLGLNYDRKRLFDKDKQEYYSLDVVLDKLCKYGLRNKFLQIVIFDYLIGNSDRHQSNWALLTSNLEKFTMCPLYDNGSSLCSYILEEKISKYLGKDEQLFTSLVDTKSKSRIRINKKKQQQPTHLEVMSYVNKNYFMQTKNIINNICKNITKANLNKILDNNYKELISDNRRQLIIKFLLKKVENLVKLYEGSD